MTLNSDLLLVISRLTVREEERGVSVASKAFPRCPPSPGWDFSQVTQLGSKRQRIHTPGCDLWEGGELRSALGSLLHPRPNTQQASNVLAAPGTHLHLLWGWVGWGSMNCACYALNRCSQLILATTLGGWGCFPHGNRSSERSSYLNLPAGKGQSSI